MSDVDRSGDCARVDIPNDFLLMKGSIFMACHEMARRWYSP